MCITAPQCCCIWIWITCFLIRYDSYNCYRKVSNTMEITTMHSWCREIRVRLPKQVEAITDTYYKPLTRVRHRLSHNIHTRVYATMFIMRRYFYLSDILGPIVCKFLNIENIVAFEKAVWRWQFQIKNKNIPFIYVNIPTLNIYWYTKSIIKKCTSHVKYKDDTILSKHLLLIW